MKERDTAADARRLHFFAWCVIIAVVGAFAGSLVGGPTAAILGALIGGAGTLAVVSALSSGAATTAGVFLAPSGRTTPGESGFSLVESFAARGLVREAAAGYEALAAAHDEDPQPCLRLARLNRDLLHDHGAAATWFIEARRRVMDPALEHLIVNELVELFVRRMNEPVRALPELARYAHKHAGTPHGERAAAELARIKRGHLPLDP